MTTASSFARPFAGCAVLPPAFYRFLAGGAAQLDPIYGAPYRVQAVRSKPKEETMRNYGWIALDLAACAGDTP